MIVSEVLNTMNLKEFGRYLHELRIKSGYRSQRELADTSRVSHSTINRIEVGTHRASIDNGRNEIRYKSTF